MLLCFLGLVCLGVEACGFAFHREGKILQLVLFILLSAIPFTIAAHHVTTAQRLARNSLGVILFFGVLMRISLVPLDPPYLSTDIYRYIWDGRVQAAGVSPYDYVPAARNLQSLRDAAIYPKINRKDYAHTIYPPVAQLAFLIITRFGESVWTMKAGMAFIDLLTVGVLLVLLRTLHLAPERVILYAWHPLAIWEFSGSGHVDALMIFFIVLALLLRSQERPGLTGASLACATLVKFVPILLFPALYKRWNLRMPVVFAVTLIVFYLPYLLFSKSSVLGFLPQYASEEGFVGGQRFYVLNLSNYLLGANSTPSIRFVIALIFPVLAGFSAWLQCNRINKLNPGKVPNYVLACLVISIAASVLISSDYPWYYTWMVPFLCFVNYAPALFLTLAVPILYHLILENYPAFNFQLYSAAFVPFFALVIIWLLPNYLSRSTPSAQ